MKTDTLFDFIKSAAEYSQETSDIVTAAYGIVNDMKASQQKCAELVPNTVTKLASLERVNGQPFVPDGYEKQASACLQNHADTVKLLNNVLKEYGQLKAAYDNVVKPIGTLGSASKVASDRSHIAFDSSESNAMRKFTERLNNI